MLSQQSPLDSNSESQTFILTHAQPSHYSLSHIGPALHVRLPSVMTSLQSDPELQLNSAAAESLQTNSNG